MTKLDDRYARAANRLAVLTSVIRVRGVDTTRAEWNGNGERQQRLEAGVVKLEQLVAELEADLT